MPNDTPQRLWRMKATGDGNYEERRPTSVAQYATPQRGRTLVFISRAQGLSEDAPKDKGASNLPRTLFSLPSRTVLWRAFFAPSSGSLGSLRGMSFSSLSMVMPQRAFALVRSKLFCLAAVSWPWGSLPKSISPMSATDSKSSAGRGCQCVGSTFASS